MATRSELKSAARALLHTLEGCETDLVIPGLIESFHRELSGDLNIYVIRQEKLTLARKRLVEMRISKNRARDVILELKQKRARLWSVLKGEEHRYSDTETARRRLEEQHSSISRLSRIVNSSVFSNGGASRMSATNSSAVLRRHEQLERALEDTNTSVASFHQATDSLPALV